MSKEKLQLKIDQYKRILEKCTDEESAREIQEKIDVLTGQIQEIEAEEKRLLKEEEEKRKKAKQQKQVKRNNDIDFDFTKKSDPKLVQKKKVSRKSLLDEMSELL